MTSDVDADEFVLRADPRCGLRDMAAASLLLSMAFAPPSFHSRVSSKPRQMSKAKLAKRARRKAQRKARRKSR